MHRFAFRYALQVTDWTYKMSFRVSYSFAFFLCKQKRKKHNITVNLIWWKYSAYPSNFSLCNTSHPDPNTHNHFHLLDTNELVVFQSCNINTHISSLCLVDANLLSPHRFFTVLQELQKMMHYSFMSLSQNLVSEYRSSFPVQSSASNGLLNGQSGSEGSKLLVDPFEDCCFSSCHTLLSIKFPSLLLRLYLSICIDNISSILLCCYLGHLCPWPTISILAFLQLEIKRWNPCSSSVIPLSLVDA
jgi:hypothetical protein